MLFYTSRVKPILFFVFVISFVLFEFFLLKTFAIKKNEAGVNKTDFLKESLQKF